MTTNTSIILICLAGCNLGPRVADPPDAALPIDAPPRPDAPDGGVVYVDLLPAGTVVPSIATNPELISQIKINDGLVDATLLASGGVVTRGTGKSAGATVRFWNFGVSPVELGIAVAAPLYVFGTLEGGVFTTLPNHPQLIDTIPGDTRYSPIRRVVNVTVTPLYAGELITSVAALGEALELGLVEDPVPDGTWMNLPVVLPGTTLEVAPAPTAPLPPRQVLARGYLVDVFELGTSLGRQPLRNGFIPVGQQSLLQTGVATGTPPTLPVATDPQPVFQFPIPTVAPTVFSYSPLATDVTVRLVTGIAPSAITSDLDLFRRSATGAITAYVPGNVATFTVGITTTNIQLQYTEGLP